MSKEFSIAVFGGGCFWCTEAIFQMLRGVKSVVPGYAGGRLSDPTYEQVAAGGTGHAEVVKIEFDPAVISYKILLRLFFSVHDPTTLNRQDHDVGEQYRSIILYTTDQQKQQAEDFIKDLIANKEFAKPITTELKPLEKLFPAENYHLNYYLNNTSQPYCQLMISPKVKKFKETYADLLK